MVVRMDLLEQSATMHVREVFMAKTVLWYVLLTVNPTHVNTQMEFVSVQKVGWVLTALQNVFSPMEITVGINVRIVSITNVTDLTEVVCMGVKMKKHANQMLRKLWTILLQTT